MGLVLIKKNIKKRVKRHYWLNQGRPVDYCRLSWKSSFCRPFCIYRHFYRNYILNQWNIVKFVNSRSELVEIDTSTCFCLFVFFVKTRPTKLNQWKRLSTDFADFYYNFNHNILLIFKKKTSYTACENRSKIATVSVLDWKCTKRPP